MLLVGLTGNYGTGKSIVLSQFEKLGAITLDSDKIVESLLSEEEVINKIKGLLGNQVFDEDGNLMKKKVADLIFKNDILKSYLEDLLHPLVFEKIKGFLKTITNQFAVVVIEVPLLFERGYEGRFKRTVTVVTDEQTAFQRLEKSGVSRDDAQQRIRSQLPIEVKTTKSDFVIDNNGTLEETMTQVTAIYKRLLEEARIGNH
jgi:dephospho-CoA kinase